jgi:hypothetical protein
VTAVKRANPVNIRVLSTIRFESTSHAIIPPSQNHIGTRILLAQTQTHDQQIVCAHPDAKVIEWQLNAKAQNQKIIHSMTACPSVCIYHPTTQKIAVGMVNGHLHTGTKQSITGHQEKVSALVWDKDKLYSAATSGEVIQWNDDLVETGRYWNQRLTVEIYL